MCGASELQDAAYRLGIERASEPRSKPSISVRDFVRDHTANFTKLQETVKPYTIKRVSQITGVPAGQLREVARNAVSRLAWRNCS